MWILGGLHALLYHVLNGSQDEDMMHQRDVTGKYFQHQGASMHRREDARPCRQDFANRTRDHCSLLLTYMVHSLFPSPLDLPFKQVGLVDMDPSSMPAPLPDPHDDSNHLITMRHGPSTKPTSSSLPEEWPGSSEHQVCPSPSSASTRSSLLPPPSRAAVMRMRSAGVSKERPVFRA